MTMDLHIDNTVYLLHEVSCAYLRAHNMTRKEFGALDDKFHLLRYVAMCPSRFDALPEEQLEREIDDYVRQCA